MIRDEKERTGSYDKLQDRCWQLWGIYGGHEKESSFCTCGIASFYRRGTVCGWWDIWSVLTFWQKMKESPNCPKSSCPSPEVYRAAFDCGAEHLYAITLSAELSGSYNSAVLGMNLFLENHPDAKVHVFNSCSASVGETLLQRRSLSTKRRVLILKQLLRRWMNSSFICIRILCWRAWTI